MFGGQKKQSKVETNDKDDPKNILCAYFKVGLCQKGHKCKFSHDLQLEKKSAKINIYHDPRANKTPLSKEEDVMGLWDSEKLHKVISQKQKNYKERNETRNVCKYFLTAVEGNLYGWFWTCPNGDSCIYRHALPPGYILKRDKKKIEKYADDDVCIEERLENERTKVFFNGNGTKVEKETLISLWTKLNKLKEAEEKNALKQLSLKQKKKKTGQKITLTGK